MKGIRIGVAALAALMMLTVGCSGDADAPSDGGAGGPSQQIDDSRDTVDELNTTTEQREFNFGG